MENAVDSSSRLLAQLKDTQKELDNLKKAYEKAQTPKPVNVDSMIRSNLAGAGAIEVDEKSRASNALRRAALLVERGYPKISTPCLVRRVKADYSVNYPSEPGGKPKFPWVSVVQTLHELERNYGDPRFFNDVDTYHNKPEGWSRYGYVSTPWDLLQMVLLGREVNAIYNENDVSYKSISQLCISKYPKEIIEDLYTRMKKIEAFHLVVWISVTVRILKEHGQSDVMDGVPNIIGFEEDFSQTDKRTNNNLKEKDETELPLQTKDNTVHPPKISGHDETDVVKSKTQTTETAAPPKKKRLTELEKLNSTLEKLREPGERSTASSSLQKDADIE